MLTIKDTCTVHNTPVDTSKPVITLKGSKKITLNLNDTYKEEGATATDETDGDITSKIVISGKVDTSKAGTYTLTYTVEDSAKNVTNVTRTVIVKDGSGGGDSPGSNTTQNSILNHNIIGNNTTT